jgi:hypothetical protein
MTDIVVPYISRLQEVQKEKPVLLMTSDISHCWKQAVISEQK